MKKIAIFSLLLVLTLGASAQYQEPFGSDPSIAYSVSKSPTGVDLSITASNPIEVVVFSDYTSDSSPYAHYNVNGLLRLQSENLAFIINGDRVTSMVYLNNSNTDVLVVNGALRDYWVGNKYYRYTGPYTKFFAEDKYWSWGRNR